LSFFKNFSHCAGEWSPVDLVREVDQHQTSHDEDDFEEVLSGFHELVGFHVGPLLELNVGQED
jgi:hypothetical protein